MSHWIMGIIAGLAGLTGLFMAGAARDAGIFWFGMSLAAFGVLFMWWMIKTAHDESEAAIDLDHRMPTGKERMLPPHDIRSAA